VVAQEFAEAINAGRFHLEVGDTVGAIGKVGEPVDEFGLGEAEAQDAALRAIKAGTGDGDTLVEAGSEMPQQGGAGTADIGLRQPVVELGLRGEAMEELAFVFAGVMAVEIEEVVDAEAMGGGYEAIDGDIFLQGATGADTDNRERGEGFFDGAGRKVDIGEGIEFVEYNIDIIGADAGGYDGDAFFADAAGVGDEFAVMGTVFDGVEMTADAVDPVGIADGEDGGCEFFGTEVEMIDGAAAIDNEFAFRDWLHKMSKFFLDLRKNILILQPPKKIRPL